MQQDNDTITPERGRLLCRILADSTRRILPNMEQDEEEENDWFLYQSPLIQIKWWPGRVSFAGEVSINVVNRFKEDGPTRLKTSEFLNFTEDHVFFTMETTSWSEFFDFHDDVEELLYLMREERALHSRA